MKRFAKLVALCIVMTLVAAALFSIPAQALGSTDSKTIVGLGSVGTGIGNQTTLVDFTASDLCGFEAVGNTTAPTFHFSSAWQSNVLYTWVNSAENETGIRGTLTNASLLQGASTLSVRLFAQYTKATSHEVMLRLEGVDKNGTPLTLETTAAECPASWQTVTFDISAFVESANLDSPCTVTILTSTVTESEEFVLWVHSIYIGSLETYPEFLIPVAATACGFIVGFTLFFVIYRATCKKNRRPRREEER